MNAMRHRLEEFEHAQSAASPQSRAMAMNGVAAHNTAVEQAAETLRKERIAAENEIKRAAETLRVER